jgi:hypothetical protein
MHILDDDDVYLIEITTWQLQIYLALFIYVMCVNSIVLESFIFVCNSVKTVLNV